MTVVPGGDRSHVWDLIQVHGGSQEGGGFEVESKLRGPAFRPSNGRGPKSRGSKPESQPGGGQPYLGLVQECCYSTRYLRLKPARRPPRSRSPTAYS